MMPGAKMCDLTNDFFRSIGQKRNHVLYLDQSDILLQPSTQPRKIKGTILTVFWLSRHPDFISDNLDLVRRCVVGPKIEGASTAQIELGVMPMASQHSILDRPFAQWEAHVRTTIVQRKDVSIMPANQNRTMQSRNRRYSLLLDAGQGTGQEELFSRRGNDRVIHN